MEEWGGDSRLGGVQLYQGRIHRHNHGCLHLSAVEIPDIAGRDGGLHVRMAESAGGKVKSVQPQVAAQLPAENLHQRRVAAVADEKGDLFKAVAGQAFADVIEQVIVGVRAEGDGTAEIFVFRAQTHRDHREDQHGKILAYGFQLFFQIRDHGICDDVVGPQGGLISVLFQGA